MTDYIIKVIEVIDGNTFGTTKGIMKLNGVNTPTKDEYGGIEASVALSTLISNQVVKITEISRDGEIIMVEVHVERINDSLENEMVLVNDVMQVYSKD